MHYIVGTEILISERTVAPIKPGPQPLNVPQIPRKAKQNPYFELGVRYTLYTIRPEQGRMVYVFAREDGATITHVFESVHAAESVIADAKKETLPDYDGYHRQFS